MTELLPERIQHLVAGAASGCWVFRGSPSHRYGEVRLSGGRRCKAHRLVWEHVHGPIPPGFEVCHTCDVPKCVRPDHLFLGTHQDNMSDMVAKGRQRFLVGASNGNARLSDQDIVAMRQMRASGERRKNLAKRFGVSEKHVGDVTSGAVRVDAGGPITPVRPHKPYKRSIMKEVRKLGCQGDVLFRNVRSLPAGARKQDRSGSIVVAHSETGHHHTVDATDVVHFTVDDPMICYLRVDGAFADVVHHRSFDTHETIRLLGGGSVYEVRRQREWTPEGWRRIED